MVPGARADDDRPVSRDDEVAHRPASDPRWSEWWDFDLCQPDGSLGVVVRVGFHPSLGVATYLAGVVGPARAPVLVVDDEAPLPRRAGALELRSPGLWADHNLESPLVHWSLGLEAFGLALDDATLDLLALEPGRPGSALVGERTPLGLDLEWETTGPVRRWPVGAGAIEGYGLAARVHGEVLVGQEVLEVDGPGSRNHGWGLGSLPGSGPGAGSLELHQIDGGPEQRQPGADGSAGRSEELRVLASLPLPGSARVGRPAWWRTLVATVDGASPAVGWAGGPRRLEQPVGDDRSWHGNRGSR